MTLPQHAVDFFAVRNTGKDVSFDPETARLVIGKSQPPSDRWVGVPTCGALWSYVAVDLSAFANTASMWVVTDSPVPTAGAAFDFLYDGNAVSLVAESDDTARSLLAKLMRRYELLLNAEGITPAIEICGGVAYAKGVPQQHAAATANGAVLLGYDSQEETVVLKLKPLIGQDDEISLVASGEQFLTKYDAETGWPGVWSTIGDALEVKEAAQYVSAEGHILALGQYDRDPGELALELPKKCTLIRGLDYGDTVSFVVWARPQGDRTWRVLSSVPKTTTGTNWTARVNTAGLAELYVQLEASDTSRAVRWNVGPA